MLKKKLYLFLTAFCAFIVYLPSLFFKFTYFDDHILVLENQGFLRHWSNIPVAFQREVFHAYGGGAGYYRPFLTLSFIWDAHWSGINPFCYHLTNIILHVAVSCLVYLVLTQISNAGIQIKNSKNSKGDRINLFLALLFAVHPVLVQAVAWIPGRNDSLLTLFILLSFYFFLRSKRYFLHLLFFLCALFTKETALAFPFVLWFYSYFCARNHLCLKPRQKWKYYTGWAVCMAVFLFAKYFVIGNLAIGMTLKDIALSMAKNFPALFLFIGKVFLPVNLSVLPILRDSNLVIGEAVSAIIAIILGLWFFSTKARYLCDKAATRTAGPEFAIIFFGIVWFLAFLLPPFILPVPYFLEHRTYLPMMGVLFALQGVLVSLRPRLQKYNSIIASILTLIILSFAVIAVNHSLNFRDGLTLWKRAVADSPHSPLARKNLGAMFYLDGNLILAQYEFRKSLELNPQETIAHNNLGLILMKSGKTDEAEKEYLEEIRINPVYDNVYYNFGILKYRQNKLNEAEKLWLKTVELNPGYADAWRCLIKLADERSDQKKMQMYLRKAKNILE